MTPTDLRATIQRLGLTQAEVAALLGRSPQQLRKWLYGKHAIPHWVPMMLRATRIPSGQTPA